MGESAQNHAHVARSRAVLRREVRAVLIRLVVVLRVDISYYLWWMSQDFCERMFGEISWAFRAPAADRREVRTPVSP